MKKHNFSAGPSVLPEVALENAAKAIFDFKGTGLSVLSYSHRSKEFEEVLAEAKSLFRELLNIPENYSIYFVGVVQAHSSSISLPTFWVRRLDM